MKQRTICCEVSYTVMEEGNNPHIEDEQLAILLLQDRVPKGYSLVEGPDIINVSSSSTNPEV